MNTLYFTYALEVERTRSITQAAENLFMTQPTLSKAIKDLENELGFEVFQRTRKGIVPTPRGAQFLIYAKKIAAQLSGMEHALQAWTSTCRFFSLAMTRVGYMADAAARFSADMDDGSSLEVDFLETSSIRVIDAVANSHYMLGLIRCSMEDADYFKRSLKENGLDYETVWESDYRLLMSAEHPLAGETHITPDRFAPFVEIIFGDESVPYILNSDANNIAHGHSPDRRLLIYDRATAYDLLRQNKNAYLWSSPVFKDMLTGIGLVQRNVPAAGRFCDLLIYRKGYHLSKLDYRFLDYLALAKNHSAAEN